MTELCALRGFPASGKTTRARQLADSGSNGVVVGRDFLRAMLFDKYYSKPDPDREVMVTTAQQAQVRALLLSGVSVFVDDTNLDARYLRQWAKVAAESGAAFRIEDVKTDLETCQARDLQRADRGERYVGHEVIRRMAKRWPIDKWPTVEARPPVVVEPYIRDETLRPHAVIVDIDGTLAEMQQGGRSPYDYTRVSEDGVHEDVAQTIRDLSYHSDLYILIVSGRDDTCRDETVAWLKANDIPFDRLWMRPAESRDMHGNKLRDVDVKLAIFNKHIRDSFNVRMVLDDRDQVVSLWRALGIRCWQVAPGNF